MEAVQTEIPDMVVVPLVDSEARMTGQFVQMLATAAENSAGKRIVGSTRIMGEMGHMLITWTEEQDADIIASIQKKMDAGYSFFIVESRAFGLLAPTKTEIKNVTKQKKAILKTRTVEVKDADFSALVDAGKAGVTEERAGGGEIETVRRLDPKTEPDAAKVAAKSDTVAVPPRKGG